LTRPIKDIDAPGAAIANPVVQLATGMPGTDAAGPADLDGSGGGGNGSHRRAPVQAPAAPLIPAGQAGRGRARRKPVHPMARQVGRGLEWTFANTVSPRSGTLLIGLVFARLAGPADLGALGVAIVMLLAMRSLAGLGITRAIAFGEGEAGETAPTAMAISLTASVVVSIGGYLAAPAVCAVMGTPAAIGVIRMLALSVVINGVAAGPRGVLQRRAPGRRALVDQLDNWVGVAVTIGLAVSRFSLMSVAVGRIAGSVIAVVGCIALAPESVRIGFQRDHAVTLLRAGLPSAAFGVTTWAIISADLIAVGVRLHASSLGLYFLALCCATWPITAFSQPVRDMASAAFAHFRHGPRIASSAFMSSARLLASLTVPICVLLVSSAAPLIHALYGARWATAASVLVWLAPLAALRVFYEFANDYFAVLVSSRRGLVFQLIWLITLVPALVLGIRVDGIAGAAWVQLAVVGAMVPVWLVLQIRPAAAVSKLPPMPLKIPLAAAAAMSLVAFGIRRAVQDDQAELGVSLAAALAITGLLVYRLRAVATALRRAAARAATKPWPITTDAPSLVLHSAFETSLNQVYAKLPPPPLVATLPAGPEPAAERALDQADATGQESLGQKVKAGAWWSIANTVTMRVATFATTIVLARTVFGPEAFGLYAVSQLVLALLLSVNELAVSLAIVRWDDDVRTFAPTVFTLSVAFSALIYGGLFVIAPEAARLLGSPGATSMIRLLSVCVILDGLICVPFALLTRTFAQNRLMLVNALNFVVTTGITFWLAFAGLGPISFAWGAVIGGVVALVAAFFAAPFVVLPGWNNAQARRLMRFGLPLAGASLLMLGVYNVDSAIVGSTLGPAALGLYSLAFNISSWPARSISEAARRVSFASFSRLAHSADQLSDGFCRALGLVMAVTVPACVLLATLAQPLIRLVYGERWISAAPALTLLAVLGLLRVAYDLTYDCLASTEKRSTLLGVQGLWLAALIPALLIGAHKDGIVGVSAGHVVVAVLLVCPAFLWGLSRCGISVRRILAACRRPFFGGILMIAASEAVLRALGGSLAGVVAAGTAGAVVYLPVVFPMRALLRTPQAAPAAADAVQV
jgi:O-antigen/teichoic acid export membrane protein